MSLSLLSNWGSTPRRSMIKGVKSLLAMSPKHGNTSRRRGPITTIRRDKMKTKGFQLENGSE